MHALESLKKPLPVQPEHAPVLNSEILEDNQASIPCTSLPCKWVVPKCRKETSQQISTAVFKKHERDRPVKRQIPLLENFDPRPPEYRGNAQSFVPDLLKKVKGEHLGISVLLDAEYIEESEKVQQPSSYNLPNLESLKLSVEAFKKSLVVDANEAREIERKTREQRMSTAWFTVRQYRLTASRFGDVISRKQSTPPDKLVLNILQPTYFTSVAMKYGIDNEKHALEAYVTWQHNHGHPDLIVSPSGFIINPLYSFLGASPDGAVHDPSHADAPFGFVEIKCPYSVRDLTPVEATHTPGFCCVKNDLGDLELKEKHSYFAQIQGQMAIGERPWCDFVIYTQKGINVQRISFNQDYWKENLTKLVSFYDTCIAPEIVCPRSYVGLPVRKIPE